MEKRGKKCDPWVLNRRYGTMESLRALHSTYLFEDMFLLSIHPSRRCTNSDSTRAAPVGLLTENISCSAEPCFSSACINECTMLRAAPIREANLRKQKWRVHEWGHVVLFFACIYLHASVSLWVYIYLNLLMWLCAYFCLCVCAHTYTHASCVCLLLLLCLCVCGRAGMEHGHFATELNSQKRAWPWPAE